MFRSLMEKYVSGLRGSFALYLSALNKNQDLSGKGITLVIGNESCDLDSAVSAVVLAYFLNTREILKEHLIVPLFNVPIEDVALKTEVVFCMNACKMAASDVPCREEVKFDILRERNLLKLILVDHHTLFDDTFEDCLSEIIDHRPISQLPASCKDSTVKVIIKPVGSCSTLVLKRIWEISPDFKDPEALKLIRFAIISDTVNFSAEAKKATQEDIDVINRIDVLLGLDKLSRRVDYELVLQAKQEIQNLTVTQCLRKDLKIVEKNGKLLAMASFVTFAASIVEREGFSDEALDFLKGNNCDVLVIMGMKISKTNGPELVERDIAIFPESHDLATALIEQLPSKPQLQLEAKTCSVPNVKVFKQGDVAYSRKKVLPMIKDMM